MMTRRRLLQLGLAAAAIEPRALAQDAPAGTLTRDGDRFRLRSPLSGDELSLSANAPIFEFDGFLLGGQSAGSGEWRRADDGAWTCTWRVGGAHEAEIVATLAADAKTGVFTRATDLRLLSGGSALLRTVTLDAVDAAGQAPVVREGAPQSYPVLCKSFWFGVRYPIAFARAEGGRLQVGHRPGRRIAEGEAYRARQVVYGCSPAGKSREAFESYMAGLRPTPRGVHFNYNSWWTSPVPYTEKDIIDLIEQFRRNLYLPHGVSPDTFCIDMGWAKNTTLWQIDPTLFPQGFSKLQKACDGIKSHLGLWISPSGVYGQALDLGWAKGAGYEADGQKACLGGPKYQQAFKEALLDHVTRFGIRHVKFDGYVPTCIAKDHGHEPGDYSAERIAEGIVDVFTSVRKVAPDLWMEPTCFGFDPSPWWLEYVNSVIGTFGDDAPHGRVPCPDYRQSYTTGRDFYNLKGARDILAPIAAQEVLGIIHQTPESFCDDAVMTVLRGHQFVPIYINPAHMNPRRWRFLAELMKWARDNADILEHTVALEPMGYEGRLDGQMPRKPYGYGHWHDGRGLLCLRNPWIEPATMQVVPKRDLGASESPELVDAESVYGAHGMVLHVEPAGGPHSITLAPYETCVLRYGVAREVNTIEAMPAIGTPPPVLRVNLRAGVSWFQPDDSGPRFGPDYTRLLPSDGACARLRLSGSIDVPPGGRRELYVLIEGPGPVEEPICTLTLNGRPARHEVRSSQAGWRATGAPAPEHWLWLVLPLPQGPSELGGELLLAGAGQTVAAWVGSRRAVEGRTSKVERGGLPRPESVWIDAVRAFGVVEFGKGLPTEHGPAPVVRIKGVYMDTLEPVEQSQGYGKLERNRSVWEKPMQIGGKRYLRGLGTHAVSRLVYALDGKWRRFQAWAGADEATGPTITMEVRVDGRSVWRSGLLTRGTPAHRLDVDVRGAKRLELLVGDGGNGIGADHADWADAVLLR